MPSTTASPCWIRIGSRFHQFSGASVRFLPPWLVVCCWIYKLLNQRVYINTHTHTHTHAVIYWNCNQHYFVGLWIVMVFNTPPPPPNKPSLKKKDWKNGGKITMLHHVLLHKTFNAIYCYSTICLHLLFFCNKKVLFLEPNGSGFWKDVRVCRKTPGTSGKIPDELF